MWLFLCNGCHLSRGRVALCEDVVVWVDRVQDPNHPVGVGRELPQPLDRPLHGRLDILAQVFRGFHVGTNCVRAHVGEVTDRRGRRNLAELALVHLGKPVGAFPDAVHERERHQPRLQLRAVVAFAHQAVAQGLRVGYVESRLLLADRCSEADVLMHSRMAREITLFHFKIAIIISNGRLLNYSHCHTLYTRIHRASAP